MARSTEKGGEKKPLQSEYEIITQGCEKQGRGRCSPGKMSFVPPCTEFVPVFRQESTQLSLCVRVPQHGAFGGAVFPGDGSELFSKPHLHWKMESVKT